MPQTFHNHGTTDAGKWALIVAGALVTLMLAGIIASVTGNFSWGWMAVWIGAAAFVVLVLPIWSSEFLEPEAAETAPLEDEHYE